MKCELVGIIQSHEIMAGPRHRNKFIIEGVSDELGMNKGSGFGDFKISIPEHFSNELGMTAVNSAPKIKITIETL